MVTISIPRCIILILVETLQESLEFMQNGTKTQTFCEWRFCRQKCLVEERGQKRKARWVRADRKSTVSQIRLQTLQNILVSENI